MTIKQQYNKELRRIKRFINSLEKAGVQVSFEIPKIPKRITRGSVSKLAKITKDIILAKSEATEFESGKVKTGRAILGLIQKKKEGKVSILDTSTGEIIEGRRKKINEYRNKVVFPKHSDAVQSQEIPERSRIIMDNATSEILDNILEWLSDPVDNPKWSNWYKNERQKLADKLKSAIDETINRNGYESTAFVVENNARAFRDAIEAIHYYKEETGTIDSISMQVDNLIGILFGAMSMNEALELSEYEYFE